MSLIRLSHLTKIYKGKDNVAIGIQDVNLQLDVGEFVAILGSSGSGKTTLLNVISGIDSYEEGDFYINGESTSDYTMEDFENYRRANVAFIFQNYQLIDSYTVLENVMVELIFKGFKLKDARVRAKEILAKVGLSHRLKNRATKLSGGEKQRVVIARAIASDAKILVCDEPTGNLDSTNSLEIMKLLKEIATDKLVLLVTHDESLVEGNANRVIRIKDGKIESDVTLNKVETKEVELAKPKPNKISTQLYIAFKNVFRTPKKSFFVLFVFMILSFVLISSVAFLPTKVKEIDVSTMEYDTFNNRDDNRIIVFDDKKANEEIQKDYIYLENDYLLDIDYKLKYYNSELNMIVKPTSNIKVTLDHLQVFSGRIPQEDNEMLLIVKPEYEISVYDVILQNVETSKIKIGYGTTTNLCPTVYNLVGFACYTQEYTDKMAYNKDSTSSNSSSLNTLYNKTDFYINDVALKNLFKEYNEVFKYDALMEASKDFTYKVNNNKFAVKVYDGTTTAIKINYRFNVDNKPIGELYFGSNKIDISSIPYEFEFTYDDSFSIGLGINIASELVNNNLYRYSVYASDNKLYPLADKLKADDPKNLFILKDLRKVKANYNIQGILDNLIYLFFLIIEIVVSLFITILITSFILGSKKKELGVLRVIGLSEKDVLRILHYELFVIMAISIFLTLGLASILSFTNAPFNFNYIYESNIKLIVSVILLLLMTYFIANAWNKKMFKKSAREVLKVGDSL